MRPAFCATRKFSIQGPFAGRSPCDLMAAMPTSRRSSPSTNLAVLDARVFDDGIAAILDAKREEIKEQPRYRDDSYFDDDGVHHMRGGVWNDTSDRAVDGYTKQDVEDVRAELRDLGLQMEFTPCDAMMAEYFRTGRLSIDVRSPGDSAMTPVMRTSNKMEVRDLGRDRYRVAGEVVSFYARRTRCTCRPKRCMHEVAARRRRDAWAPSPDRFTVSDQRLQQAVRKTVAMLRSLPDAEPFDTGRRPYSTRQRVLALVIRRLFGGQSFDEGAAAAVKAGYFKLFPTRSLTRFRKDPDVKALLERLAASAAGSSIHVQHGADTLDVLIAALDAPPGRPADKRKAVA